MAKKKKVVFNVYGIDYKKENVRSIGKLNPDYELKDKELWEKYTEGASVPQYQFDISDVQLIPEPANPYDPNAIMVIMNGAHIGYINRNSTDKIRAYINRDDIEHLTGFLKGGKAKILCISSSGKHYIRDYDYESYQATVTLNLKEGRSVQEIDGFPPKDEKLGYNPNVAKAAAASGSGCLIPVLLGISLVGTVISLL